MNGIFCYRFKDAKHAEKMLASLGPEHEALGTGGVLEGEDGHCVTVVTETLLGVKGWQEWEIAPAKRQMTAGGLEDNQDECEKYAPKKSAIDKVSDVVPGKAEKTKEDEQEEAIRISGILEVKAAKLEAGKKAAEENEVEKRTDGRSVYEVEGIKYFTTEEDYLRIKAVSDAKLEAQKKVRK